MGSGASTPNLYRHYPGGGLERLPLFNSTQRLLPATGYWAHHGRRNGCAGHFVSVHERQTAALRGYRDETSRARLSSRVCRRKYRLEPGPVLHDAEAAGTTEYLPCPALLAALPGSDGGRCH